MHTGLDGAKAIVLGADLVGFGISILKEAITIRRGRTRSHGNKRIGTSDGYVWYRSGFTEGITRNKSLEKIIYKKHVI